MSDQTDNQEELTPEQLEALRDPNNAANPAAIKAKVKSKKDIEKRAARRDAQLRAVLGALLDTVEGRVFAGWLLIEVAGLYRQEVPVDMDKDRMLFLGGSRAVALALHDKFIAADAPRYMAVMAEQLKELNDV